SVLIVATVLGLCPTGKFTELAMKQSSFARLCNLLASEIIEASVTVTIGLSVTFTNRPLPVESSSITPIALSTYSVTTTPACAHRCKYQSMWQVDNEETNSSSGLCLVLSPRNAGSEEPKISDLLSIETT